MKENIFDVLIYLFENYMEDEIELLPESDEIKTELQQAGFEQTEVNKAFDWLESLSLQSEIQTCVSSSFRIFSTQEQTKLDQECINFLMFIENNLILSTSNREIVIDRIMALEEEITLEKVKWITLMVLLSQPDEEIAFSRMEDIVYDLVPTYLH